MSQLIELPVRFEFATERKRWEVCEARLAGYARDFYPKPAPTAFPAIIGATGSLNTEIALHVVRGGSLSALYREEPEPAYTVFLGDRDLLQRRFAPGDELTQDAAAYEPFEVVVSFDSSPSKPQSRDPWKMRDEFIELENTSEKLAAFLTKWGDWDLNPLHQINEPFEHEVSQAQVVKQFPLFALPETIWQTQALYRKAMTQKPARWLAEHGRLPGLQRIESAPFFECIDRYCSSALETTITLDHLRRIQHRVCARPDCGALFKVESAHVRAYCSQPCAHAEHMRRTRKAKRLQRAKLNKGA